MRNFALIILLLLTATAAAEPHRFAVSVNSPISWTQGFTIGASAYAALSEHQALRLNVASHDIGDDLFKPDGLRYGRIVDVGAGWMYFPRRTFDGPMLELGVLRRSGATYVNDTAMDPAIVDRDTQLYAARALVGWSWLVRDRIMISLAAGAAQGYELGTETTTREFSPGRMTETHEVSQWTTTIEGYFRVGFTF